MAADNIQSLEVAVSSGVPVIYLRSEIVDDDALREFQSALDELALSTTSSIVVNLGDVRFVDSRFFDGLVTTEKRLRVQKRRIILCEMQTDVRNVVRITGINRFIACRDHYSEALEEAAGMNA